MSNVNSDNDFISLGRLSVLLGIPQGQIENAANAVGVKVAMTLNGTKYYHGSAANSLRDALLAASDNRNSGETSRRSPKGKK